MAKDILERTCNNEDCPTWTYTADAPVINAVIEFLNEIEVTIRLPVANSQTIIEDVLFAAGGAS